MARFQDQITDEHLHGIADAQIWVFHASGENLGQQAALTDDFGVAFVQPLISDPDGIFYYNTAEGLYENHIHYGGQLRYVQQCLVGEMDGGGGTAVWGEITGTLSDQADLQAALDGKADADHSHAGLVSDGDFGDVVISGGGTVYTYQDFAQPTSHGATGDGIANDYAAVVACDAALAAGAAMVITKPYKINSDLTLTRPVVFNGVGKFVLPTGIDLAINAPISAGRAHIFDCTGTATATLDVGSNHIRFPEWWGATLGADCSAAFVHALKAGTETVCAARDYVVTTNPGILVPAFATLSGAGPDYEGAGTATRILMVGGANTIIQIGSTATPIDVNSSPAAAKLKTLCVARNAAPMAGSVGILVAWSRFVQISDVRSTNSLYCWRFTNTVFCEGIRLRAKRDTPINTGVDVAVGFDIYGSGALPAAGGNASLWLTQPQAELNIPITNSAAYNYSGRFTDNFLLNAESVSWSYDLKITGDGAGGNSASNTNLFVAHPVFDACKITSIRVDDVNKWGSIEIHMPYIGPSADASLGYFNNCLGVVSINGGQCRLTASNGTGFSYVNCRAPILDNVTIAECSTQAVVLSGVVGGRIAPVTINATDTLSAAVQAVANVTDCIIEPICTGEAVKVSFGYQSLAVSNDYNAIWTTGMVRAVVNADLSIFAGAELNSVIDGGAGEAGLADGDYGDVLVGGDGTTMTVQSAGGAAVATVSQLANYLPLTGGSLSGNFAVTGTIAASGTIGTDSLFSTGGATGMLMQGTASIGYFSADNFAWRNRATSTNYMSLSSAGDLTVIGSITLLDEAYNSAWNGKLEAPTKNALWDKIEALAAGGSGVTSFNTRTGAITLTSADVTTALTFTPAQAVHTHAIADTTGLQAALDGKQPAGSYSLTSHDHAGVYAPLVHTHTIANVTGLQTALDGKADDADLAGYSLTSHTHASFAADITVPDEAYGGTWNGSLEVPTKNAVYDKIEAVTAGGGGVTTFNTRSGAVTLTAADVTAAMPAFTGDVTSAAGATANTIAAGAVSLAKMADVATGTVFYRKTAGSGPPEAQTLATLKTDLALTEGDLNSTFGHSVFARIGSSGGVLSEVQLAPSNLFGRGATGNIAALTLNTTLSFTAAALGVVKVPNAATFTNSGGAAAGSTYDGSAALTIGPATIGAAAAVHTHVIADVTGLQSALDSKATTAALASYLPLTGGTLTGNLTVATAAANALLAMTPGGAALYSIFTMKGNGGSAALGLDIAAGNGAAYFSADAFTFRNAAQSANFIAFNATGLTVTGSVTLTDEIYNAAWNGKSEAPTKNAVYDKIELLTTDIAGKATVSQLSNYLPLTGGTLTGQITVNGNANLKGSTQWRGPDSGAPADYQHYVFSTNYYQFFDYHIAAGGVMTKRAGTVISTAGVYRHAPSHVFENLARSVTFATIDAGGLAVTGAIATQGANAGLNITARDLAANFIVYANANSLYFYASGAVRATLTNAGNFSVTGTLTASGLITASANLAVVGDLSVTATGNNSGVATMSPAGIGLTSILIMKGAGGNQALGLSITAGAQITYFNCDNFIFRNAAPSVEFMTLSSTGMNVNGTITLADEAYSAAWNGKLQAPTKNAVYDRVLVLTGLIDALTARLDKLEKGSMIDPKFHRDISRAIVSGPRLVIAVLILIIVVLILA